MPFAKPLAAPGSGPAICLCGTLRASAADAHRQGLVTLHKARIHPPGLSDHLNMVEALEYLFPDNLQLKLRQPDPDAAVDAEAERDMGARPRPIDDELVGTIDRLLVAVAGDVPHHHLVALLDLLAAEFVIGKRGAAHMGERGLPADHLRHEAFDQGRIVAQLTILIRMLAQGI